MRHGKRQTRPVRTSTLAVVRVVVGMMVRMVVRSRINEACSLVGLAVGIGGRFRGWWGSWLVAPCESSVVKALAKQDDVSDGVVNCEDDLEYQTVSFLGDAHPLEGEGKVTREEEGKTPYHRRKNALHDGTQDVEDITNQPYNDELNGESICIAALKVLNNLRREDDDCLLELVPCCEKSGSEVRRGSQRIMVWG